MLKILILFPFIWKVKCFPLVQQPEASLLSEAVNTYLKECETITGKTVNFICENFSNNKILVVIGRCFKA